MQLELKNVSYTYGKGTVFEVNALSNIDLMIEEGQFIGIIGHTGSGKSTLIQHFNALMKSMTGGLCAPKSGLFSSIPSISSLRRTFSQTSPSDQRTRV